MITGKDCDRIARELLDVRPDGDRIQPRTDWRLAAEAVANALHDRMGLDRNGNRRFQRERFLVAAGVRDATDKVSR